MTVTLVLSYEVRFPSSVFLGTYEVSSEPTVSKSSCLRIPSICTNTGFFPTNEQFQILLERGFTPSSAQSSGGSSEGSMEFQGSNSDFSACKPSVLSLWPHQYFCLFVGHTRCCSVITPISLHSEIILTGSGPIWDSRD